MRQGGLQRRSGMVWITNVRDSSVAARLFEFEFNEEQAYCLVFNGGYIRFYTQGGIVTQAAQGVTGISQANPAVVSYGSTDTYANADRVIISGVTGMIEVNEREFAVANVNTGSNTFELSGINSSAYGAYAGGGTIAEIYEIAHPYADADLFDIQIAQSGDTVYLDHPDYAPRKLVRTSETSWALSTIEFDNGPYLDEDTQGTTITPSATGRITPAMTSNSLPSGTVAASDSGSDAFQVFDTSNATVDSIAVTSGAQWSYDWASTTAYIADGYWIRSGPTLGNAPSGWIVQGYNGSAWVTLDVQKDQTVWGRNETRFFKFENTTAYQSYLIYVTDVDGGTATEISEWAIHFAEADATSGTGLTLTASSTTGINGGAGFLSTDVGRTIRLLDTQDGHWRWARITGYTSTTVVSFKTGDHALSTLGAISHWQMSAWSVPTGYPSAVGFFQDRLGWAGSDAEPLKLWLSKSSDYEDHGISDPAEDTDGINVEMTGGRLNRIGFLDEMDPLVAGTPGTMRVIGPLDSGAALSNTNIQQKANGTIGAAAIQPLIIGVTMLFVDRFKKRVYEFAFSLESNSYIPRELSIESDHLLLSGIVECSFQQDPDNLCWYPAANGRVAVLTYEQSQKIAGWADVRVAGGGSADAVVESTASIPSTGGDVTYAIVKRTINGATQRSIEYSAPFFETGDTLAEAIYADAAGYYAGSATATVSGLWYLRGETVGVLADGVDVGDATVSATGVLTVPGGLTPTKIVWGKRYTSRGVTLRAPNAGNQDGSPLGRRMVVNNVKMDLLNAKGMEVGTIIDGTDTLRALPRTAKDAAAGSLNTGMFEVVTTDRHQGNGVIVFENNSMYPATVRAVQISLESEP